ncbi:MAG: ATP-binding protein [Candidatus Latescibacterota bacterium]
MHDRSADTSPAALGAAVTAARRACRTVLRRLRPRRQGAASPLADIDQVLADFAPALHLIADLEPLVGEELGKLRQAVGAERLVLLLAEEEDAPFQVHGQRGCDAEALAGLRLGRQSRLIRWLVVNECPLLLDEQPQVAAFLDAADREALARLGADLVLPLTAMNRLVGLLLLRRSPGFGQRDLAFLQRLGPHLGLALQNALLLRQSRLRVRRLYRTERLATVGQLAAGAAHEIRNPLTGIRSTIQYLRRDYEHDEARRELVDELLAEVDRINQIIAGLLSFARPAAPSLEEVGVAEVLAQAANLLETTARKARVEVALDVPPDGCRLQADPAQLKQVFLNLFLNAVQAMPEGGRLVVRLQPLGEGCRVDVTDTGIGMAPEDLERIFDPFFTTKEEGTGLGLAICHGIVSRHGGLIDVHSTPGCGTRVTVRLPGRVPLAVPPLAASQIVGLPNTGASPAEA